MADSKLAPSRPHALHATLAAVACVAVLGAVGTLWFASRDRPMSAVTVPALSSTRPGAPATTPSVTVPSATTPPSTASPGASAAAPVQPSFDIVRVAPQGDSVIAGRAAPGAQVVVRQGSQEIGRAQADANGDWVLVPAAPLAPGAGTLTLSEHTPEGLELQGSGSVVLVVPPRQATSTAAIPQPPALAVLTQPNAAPRLLQGPVAAGPPHLALGMVDYGNAGEVRLSGSAKPGRTVRVYVDGKPSGEATAQPDGSWSLVPPAEIAPGQHELRLDELTVQGSVGARVALPFARAQMQASELAPGSMVVQPRQNLWLIARHSYGAGVRYTAIYQANRSQIRDPNLIYPGQVFAIPATGAPMPTDSSKSR